MHASTFVFARRHAADTFHRLGEDARENPSTGLIPPVRGGLNIRSRA